VIGREGPGPERPGPDYPPEWDREPDEETVVDRLVNSGELCVECAVRYGETGTRACAGECLGPEPEPAASIVVAPDPWATQGPVPPPPF